MVHYGALKRGRAVAYSRHKERGAAGRSLAWLTEEPFTARQGGMVALMEGSLEMSKNQGGRDRTLRPIARGPRHRLSPHLELYQPPVANARLIAPG